MRPKSEKMALLGTLSKGVTPVPRSAGGFSLRDVRCEATFVACGRAGVGMRLRMCVRRVESFEEVSGTGAMMDEVYRILRRD